MKVIDSFEGDFFFLSNFYPSPIEYNGIVYPTVEHAFQAAKAVVEHDRLKIACADTPGQAKRLGRKIYLRPDWEEVKDEVMYDCVRRKFNDPTLRNMLINTYVYGLVERNHWHDNYWGSCTCGACKDQGANHLGKILMKVRGECINELFEQHQAAMAGQKE